MKIALFGANGQVGKRIAAEALDRGHDVLAVVRNPAVARLDDRAMVTAGDATFSRMVRETVVDMDVVVSAVGPRKAPPAVLVRAANGLLEGMAAAGVRRVVVVGCTDASVAAPAEEAAKPPSGAAGPPAGGPAGAAAPPSGPPSHKPAPPPPETAPVAPVSGPTLVEAHGEVLATLRGAPGELDWTWVAPLSPCAAGERSGGYRTAPGPDTTPLAMPDGTDAGSLSLEDLAAAVVDELEQARFGRQVMTVTPA